MNKEQFDTLMKAVHIIQFSVIMIPVMLTGCYIALCQISAKLK